MTSNADKQIVIIGAGIGGLSAAISLAVHGYSITVLEKNPTVGGKMAQVEAGGFRWDTGPSVITMRHVFEELFARANRRVEDYITFTPLEPLTRYFYSDGSTINLSQNWSTLATELARLNPADVAGYLRFLAFAADLHRITGPVFIYNQPPKIQDFLRVPMTDMLKVDPFSTLHQAISRHVHDPRIQQLLGRFATYVGANPYQAPAALAVIAHVELTGGVWYPLGGIYQIAIALDQIARDLGVRILTNKPIQSIDVANRTAIGVTTSENEIFPAESIVANVDANNVYAKLLPNDAISPSRVRRYLRQEPSCSGFVMLLGIRGTYPELAHHNIFFAQDYRQEFNDIFHHQLPPKDPTVYVAITSKTDSSHAPPDHENWFVLVNAPALNDNFDWAAETQRYREIVLRKLASHGLDIGNAIVSETILTPATIAAQSNAWRGALYGLSSNSPLNAFRRPHNRSPHIKNLYFAGGTVHPGGGVPMVTLSGMRAADLLHTDLLNR